VTPKAVKCKLVGRQKRKAARQGLQDDKHKFLESVAANLDSSLLANGPIECNVLESYLLLATECVSMCVMNESESLDAKANSNPRYVSAR
jgi:hypothetical protein